MTRLRWRVAGELCLALAVLVVGWSTFSEAARRVSLHVDETQYVWRARYFWYLVLQRDVTRREWGDDNSTHTHPMVANYLVGASLWANGYTLSTLPPRYRPARGFEVNQQQGRVPNQTTLLAARTVNVVLAAGSAVLLYLLGSLLGGPLAGLAAAAVAIASPNSQQHLVRAASDSPFIFFTLLGLVLALLGTRRRGDGGLAPGWALAVGLALGLSLSSKLTAALGLAGVGLWALLTALAGWRRSGRPGLWRAASGWLLAFAVVVAVFVASNPHLYPNPLEHTLHLIEHRTERMELQQQIDKLGIHSPLEQPRFVLGGSLIEEQWAGSRGLPLEAGLTILGAAALLVASVRRSQRGHELEPAGLLLAVTLGYFGGLSAIVHVAWDRYLAPTVVLAALLGGVGLAFLAGQLACLAETVARRVAALRWPRPDPERPG